MIDCLEESGRLENAIDFDTSNNGASAEGVTPGNHVYTAEFTITGQDKVTKSATGTLKLYMDDQIVGELEIGTHPAKFPCPVNGAKWELMA